MWPVDPLEFWEDRSGAAWHVQAEFDDGNGMWVNLGVSLELSTCLGDGVRRSATLPPASPDPLHRASDKPGSQPLERQPRHRQASAPESQATPVYDALCKQKALMNGGILP